MLCSCIMRALLNFTGYLPCQLISLLTHCGSSLCPQDGEDERVGAVVKRLEPLLFAPPRTKAFHHWQRKREHAPLRDGKAWVAINYKVSLHRVFNERNHSHAILVEDDMKFSPGG